LDGVGLGLSMKHPNRAAQVEEHSRRAVSTAVNKCCRGCKLIQHLEHTGDWKNPSP